MIDRLTRLAVVVCLLGSAAGCAETPTSTVPTPAPTPTPPSTPVITVGVPTPVSPTDGATFYGWPTLTVRNAERANTQNALVYRFDISDRSDFATVAVSSTVQETAEQTSFTANATQTPSTEGTFYWRVVAADQANAVQSAPSPAQSFGFFADTAQNRLARDLYGALWGAARPSGTTGKTRMGPGWGAGLVRSFNGVTFQSPPLEVLRIFDLLDRGYSPQAAIDWMNANGYPTVAVWYAGPAAMGFPYQYLTLLNGGWELVRRVGA